MSDEDFKATEKRPRAGIAKVAFLRAFSCATPDASFPPKITRRGLRKLAPLSRSIDVKNQSAPSTGRCQTRAAWIEMVRRERTQCHVIFWLDRFHAIVVQHCTLADTEAAERLWHVASSGAASNRA